MDSPIRVYKAPSGWLKSAVDRLIASGREVVAPMKDDKGRIDPAAVSSAETPDMPNGIMRRSAKRCFFPETEVLLKFKSNGTVKVDVVPGTPPRPKDLVIIGCRPCDAAAAAIMDEVFHWDYKDTSYEDRRHKTTMISFACKAPDAKCFCTSVGGSPHDTRGSDIIVYQADDGDALLQIVTDKGNALAEELSDVLEPEPKPKIPAPPEIPKKFDAEKIRKWLDNNFEDAFWDDIALRCLGCEGCSYLCPTCHCFDIVDEALWSRGERRRNWDCCSFGLFTKHASGHNPRPAQVNRCRQRVMHKFKYYPEKFGAIACVGCGRCMRTCGAAQNLVNILNEIESK